MKMSMLFLSCLFLCLLDLSSCQKDNATDDDFLCFIPRPLRVWGYSLSKDELSTIALFEGEFLNATEYQQEIVSKNASLQTDLKAVGKAFTNRFINVTKKGQLFIGRTQGQLLDIRRYYSGKKQSFDKVKAALTAIITDYRSLADADRKSVVAFIQVLSAVLQHKDFDPLLDKILDAKSFADLDNVQQSVKYLLLEIGCPPKTK